MTDDDLNFLLPIEGAEIVALGKEQLRAGMTPEQIAEARGHDAGSGLFGAYLAEMQAKAFDPDRFMAALHAGIDRDIDRKREIERAEIASWSKRRANGQTH